MTEYKETQQITAGSVYEFAEEIQNWVLQGYRVDIDNADHFPQMIGFYFHAVLVKKDGPLIPSNPPLSLSVKLDTQQAVEGIEKLLEITKDVEGNTFTEEQEEAALKIAEQALFVEPNIVAPKPKGGRPPKK